MFTLIRRPDGRPPLPEVDTLYREQDAIFKDRNLTTPGRLVALAKAAKPALLAIRQARAAILARQRQLAKEVEATLAQRAPAPTPLSPEEMAQALELGRVMRADAGLRESVVRAVATKGPEGAAYGRLLTGIPSALAGIPASLQDQLRMVMAPTLSKNEQLAVEQEQHELAREDAALFMQHREILGAADYDTLVEMGLLTKPVTPLSVEEKVAIVQKEGLEGFKQRVLAEFEDRGGPMLPGRDPAQQVDQSGSSNVDTFAFANPA